MTDYALPSSAPRTLHKANLELDDYSADNPARVVVTDVAEATVISSLIPMIGMKRHYPVLDIDVPAVLVPSSTPGHSHLYIDHSVDDEDYWVLCDALASVGILQPGYVSASKERGYTSVRLPWIKKGEAS